MSGLLQVKEKLKGFYGKNDVFINPIIKFLLAFITICMVNSSTGYMKSLDNLFVVFVISFMCALLPNGATVLLVSLVIIAQLYGLSMELAVVTLLICLVMYLFYFRFTSKESAWFTLTILCCMLKMPYVLPVAAGLISGVFTVIPIIFGVILYYIIDFSKEYALAVAVAAEETDIFENFKTVITGAMNKEIILIALSFALTIIIVYVIRRLSVDYSWIYAIVAGSLTDFVMLMVGNVIFSTSIGFLGILLGLIFSIIIGYIMYVVFFGVDYKGTEKVQFEDDTYYYYVKAVPKYSTNNKNVRVKKINTQPKQTRTVRDDIDEFEF
jgi:hypothetical protein